MQMLRKRDSRRGCSQRRLPGPKKTLIDTIKHLPIFKRQRIFQDGNPASISISNPKFIFKASSEGSSTQGAVVPTRSAHMKRRQNFGHTHNCSISGCFDTDTPMGDLAPSPKSLIPAGPTDQSPPSRHFSPEFWSLFWSLNNN